MKPSVTLSVTVLQTLQTLYVEEMENNLMFVYIIFMKRVFYILSASLEKAKKESLTYAGDNISIY